MKSEKTTRSIKNLKLIIVMLSFAVLGSLFYTYKSAGHSRNEIIDLRKEKTGLLANLEKSNLFIENIKNSSGELSEKLLAEQKNVQNLIKQLKEKELNPKTIIIYKQKTDSIDGKIISLLQQIEEYKKQIEESNTKLAEEKTNNESLKTANLSLNKKISNATKLYVYDLKSSFYKVKNKGKTVETTSASRIDKINISFKIAENELAPAANKSFYVQIIDPLNNVIGKKATATFGDKVLNYSAKTAVKYNQKTMTVSFDIDVADLVKGNYFVNLFDLDKQIMNSSFALE
jgi:type VI protein secretion system component Hcp